MDASLMYPYAKGQNHSTGAVIVDDVGEIPHGGYPDAPGESIMQFQQIPQSFPMIPEQWAEIQHGVPVENIPAQESVPLAVGTQGNPKDHPLSEFPTSIRSLESRWLNSLESQLPIQQITPASQTVGPHKAQMGQDRFQYKSENSSVSGDLSGIYECSYSATSDEPPAFADHQVDDDEVKWTSQPSSREGSQPAPKTTAFMVSEVPESMVSTIPSRSRASSTAGQRAGRSAPLAMQNSGAVRKRKTRNPGSTDQGLPRPLQIVQEDGQGGSIASADFVSPPRGARRKGPLSMVGRANAGLRRKNKDTCVQCRLNKRKCDGSSPCDACRPTLHEQPCARACFSSIVEFGTCNYISQRAVNHPTIDGSNRVRMEIPSEFDLGQLLSLLAERQGRFNIRASQSWGSLYVLDLGETYKFLKSLSEYNGNSKSTFLEFIDRRIVDSKDKSKNWLSCVADCDPMNQAYVSILTLPHQNQTNNPDPPLPMAQHAQPRKIQLRLSRRKRRRTHNGHKQRHRPPRNPPSSPTLSNLLPNAGSRRLPQTRTRLLQHKMEANLARDPRPLPRRTRPHPAHAALARLVVEASGRRRPNPRPFTATLHRPCRAALPYPLCLLYVRAGEAAFLVGG